MADGAHSVAPSSADDADPCAAGAASRGEGKSDDAAHSEISVDRDVADDSSRYSVKSYESFNSRRPSRPLTQPVDEPPLTDHVPEHLRSAPVPDQVTHSHAGGRDVHCRRCGVRIEGSALRTSLGDGEFYILHDELRLNNPMSSVSLDVRATVMADTNSSGPSPCHGFDALLASKLRVAEDVVNPLPDADRDWQRTLYGIAHDPTALSEPPRMQQPHAPFLPHGALGAGFKDAPDAYASASAPFAQSSFPPAYGWPRADAAALGGGGDALTTLASPEYDLYGFLSQAVPLTQMVSAVAEMNSQSPLMSLSSLPCTLPLDMGAFSYKCEPDEQLLPGVERPLYSTSGAAPMPESARALVSPVIAREAAVQARITSMSLSVTRGADGVARKVFAAKRSPEHASVTELSILARKGAHPRRLYECPICHKMFERAYNRKMHMTTHEAMENRLKPFICPFRGCGKQFARKHDKNRHYQGVHLRARKTVAATAVMSPIGGSPTNQGPD
ncbi:hypothetical protein MSPP1_001126 [Malassezia sp. CBS 17886]|nr:hypothetical protein MSPP1_001126 [Malassezia sp. CBS 17886]